MRSRHDPAVVRRTLEEAERIRREEVPEGVDMVRRLAIPRLLRERIGLGGGGAVKIDIESASLRVRPVAGSQLREEGDLLVIPRSKTAVDDTIVLEFVDADRYRD